MKMLTIPVSGVTRTVSDDEVRNAQEAMRGGQLGKNDMNLLDAVVSQAVNGGELKWEDEDLIF